MLNVVTRCMKNTMPQVRYRLKDQEATLLYRVYIAGHGSVKDERHAACIIDKIHQQQLWLQCSCQHEDAPLFAPVLMQGNYHLRSLSKRGTHTDNCRFKRLYEGKASHFSSENLLDLTQPFNLHRCARDTANPVTTHGQDRSMAKPSTRQPKLATILYTMLSDTALNSYQAKDKTRSLTEHYQRAKQWLSERELTRGFLAAPLVFTFPNMAQIASTLRQQAKAWPKGKTRPYALCLTTLDEINDQTAIFRFKKNQTMTLDIAGSLRFWSARRGECSAPYLALFTITDTAERPGYMQWMNGYVVPVLSKQQLLLVESDYERRVLKALIGWHAWWQSRGLDVVIEKPLLPIPVSQGESCRPDFLLRTPQQTVVLEVMGSNESEYQARKQRTHALMADLGAVVEFDATTSDFDAQLNTCLKHCSHMLLQQVRQAGKT